MVKERLKDNFVPNNEIKKKFISVFSPTNVFLICQKVVYFYSEMTKV